MKRLKSVFARLYAVLAKLSSAVLEVWKTFPEPVRTAVLLFAVGSAMLWNNQPPQTQPETAGKAEQRSANVDRTAQPTPPVSQITKTKPTRTATKAPPTISRNTIEAAARARVASSYENYGEAYRQYRSAMEALPDTQKQAIAHELQESETKNKRGDFREAALQLERLFVSRRAINQ